MSFCQSKIDSVIRTLVDRSDQIELAHLDVGVPLEDCICAVVRKAMKQLEANPAQFELFFKERKGKEE